MKKVLAITSILLLCSSCVVTRPDKTFILRRHVTIHVQDFGKINQNGRITTGYTSFRDRVLAYAIPSTREVYVPWDTIKNHPDFCQLGHEIWHMPELGGAWHPSNNIKRRN